MLGGLPQQLHSPLQLSPMSVPNVQSQLSPPTVSTAQPPPTTAPVSVHSGGDGGGGASVAEIRVVAGVGVVGWAAQHSDRSIRSSADSS